MEYTTLWQPLIVIFVCLTTGLGIGALIMKRKLEIDIALLETDLELAHTRLQELLGEYNVVRSKKTAIKPTKLDDSFKVQLQLKDDKIDRINDLLKSKTTQLEHDSNQLTIAASQILLLEDRMAKNKKVAVNREKDLQAALARIDAQLTEIDTLESDNKSAIVQTKDTNTELHDLNITIKARDMAIERNNKRIQELESLLEEYTGDDGKRLGGGVGNWKRI
jgi:chromosome segregation ATPase